ncbi:TfuA-like protein [Rhodospirillum sp. A1_3_36]|uniref:TfuA-like protein n=1 Tax=Rhodospirillum sp. A1_3_36 TaxID=3391666 RepID=UPI0039A45F2E
MSVFVFLGPSLSARQARDLLPDAVICPPVSQGDVTRAVRTGARVIGIIDGYFERVPAVWHKEILWAMSQGVHVFGASSMGALRAAELQPFGMIGVGLIFEAFRDGVLEDDDEVTVAHGPADTGYLLASVAMVDLRATLQAALAAEVVTAPVHETLLALAKATYYPERSYPNLLKKGAEAGLPQEELDALKAWLPDGQIRRKTEDARAMLEQMALFLASNPPPKTVTYHFEPTDAWEQVLRRDGHQVAAALPDALPTEALLDEVRLRGEACYEQILSGAFGRALALRETRRNQAPIDPAIFREILHAFFVKRGLIAPEKIAAWLDRQQLDTDGLTSLIAREVGIEQVKVETRDDIMGQINDVLRITGLYGDLANRAEDKQRWLATVDLQNAASADWGQDEQALLSWHFIEQRGQPVPDDLDAYARSLDLTNRHDLVRILIGDYLYSQHITNTTG